MRQWPFHSIVSRDSSFLDLLDFCLPTIRRPSFGVAASRLLGVANDCKLPQPLNRPPRGVAGRWQQDTGASRQKEGRGTKPNKVEQLPNQVLFSAFVGETFQNMYIGYPSRSFLLKSCLKKVLKLCFRLVFETLKLEELSVKEIFKYNTVLNDLKIPQTYSLKPRVSLFLNMYFYF